MAERVGVDVELGQDLGNFLAEHAKHHNGGLVGVVGDAIARYRFLARQQQDGYKPVVVLRDADGVPVDVRELVFD